MTLRVGDHLVIKREGKLIDVASEAYHEFKVLEQPQPFAVPDSEYQPHTGYSIMVEVVE